MDARTDTSSEMALLQLEIHRRMSLEQKLLLVFELSDLAREFTLAGIRHDHPEWTEIDVRPEYIRRIRSADRFSNR